MIILKTILLSSMLGLAVYVGYYNSHSNLIHNGTYIIVDFSKPSIEKRLFVYKEGVLIYSTYVAHGTGSGMGIYAVTFSNDIGSHSSSLGTYKIIGYYKGKHGVVLQVQGLSYSNNNAYIREIEIHRANYIGNGKTGHSWGCFAVPNDAMDYILKTVKPGDYLYAVQ